MTQFDRITLGRQARELGFVRDTFEKVCRLADVLAFLESDALLSKTLALKGGTAINLTIFDLPRLSVDIDLDYSENVPREEMLAQREIITERIRKYMAAAGYRPSLKSKTYHALDSFVFEYVNAGGMKDNLKIEINYMLRAMFCRPRGELSGCRGTTASLPFSALPRLRYSPPRSLRSSTGRRQGICTTSAIWSSSDCSMNRRNPCCASV